MNAAKKKAPPKRFYALLRDAAPFAGWRIMGTAFNRKTVEMWQRKEGGTIHAYQLVEPRSKKT